MNAIIVPPSFRLQFRSLCGGLTPLVGAAVMRDLSSQGCRGETVTTLRPGMVLALRIQVPELVTALIIEKAQVQWVRGRFLDWLFVTSKTRSNSAWMRSSRG